MNRTGPGNPSSPGNRIIAGRRDDRGAALMLVLGCLVLTSLVLISTLGYAIQTTVPTRKDQDAKIAAAAAQAGIDEYVSRLTADDNYWQFGDADPDNPAFGAGRTVQGTGTAGARYAYHLLSTPTSTASDGLIRLQSTGTSAPSPGHPAVSRILIATLQARGFLDYLYVSDVEVLDPSILGSPAACGTYYYAGRDTAAGCFNIQWVSGDIVRGPLHSNDALWINGSVNFADPHTESSWPALEGTTSATTWWGSQAPPLAGYPPVYAPAVQLPVSSSTVLQYVSPDVDGNPATVPGPGCYYQGATEILLQGNSMRVRSPMTARSDTPARCLNRATRSQWQTITPIPPVIYVDSATTGTCVTGATSAFSYPEAAADYTAGSSTAVSWGSGPNYSCQRGTAYLQGTASRSVTVSTADDVVITGDLTDTDPAGNDVIGLVAGNCAWVHHPVDRSGNNLAGPVNTVQAAVLALRHSFIVENWNRGAPLGTLNLTGALAQKYRGPVGTSRGGGIQATGYLKNYVYDARLRYLQPPYFLKPSSSPWALTSIVDR